MAAVMVDIVDSLTRSRMMSGIRGKDTQPEVMVRRALHARGLRFGIKQTRLPGRPDIVLPRWKVAVFVHGCFWHWHGCQLSKMPTSNREFWEKKLAGNQDRDSRAQIALISMGWRVAMIWECSLRGQAARARFDTVMDELAQWIRDQPTIVAFETTVALGHA
jgi:DNA mismatch endonuclease, patch repair protein